MATLLAIEGSGVGIFDYDPRTGTQRFSDGCKAIWGLSADEEPTPARIEALVHPEDRFAMNAAFDSLKPDGTGAFCVEHRIIRPDRAVRWIQVRGHTIFEGSGSARRAQRSLGTMRDISERRANEGKLHASEAELRAVVELSAVGMAQVSAETGRIIRANAKYCELTGYSAEELAEMTPVDLDFAEDRESDAQAIGQMFRGEIAFYDSEKRYLRKDGKIIWVHVNATLLRDADGRPERTMAVVQDINARKQAEEAQLRAEQNLRDFVESASVGMHWVGPDGIILWANRCEMEMLGYAREEYIGRPIADFHAEQAAIEDILCRLTRRETLYNYEARLRCKDGSLREVLINSNVLWEGDKFIHTRCFTRDITARKRAENCLRASEAFNRTVLESSPDCVKLLDAEGRLEFMNQTGQCLMEIDDFENFRGQPWWQLWPEASEATMRDAVKRAGRGETVHLQTFGPTAKGTPKWWDVAVAPVVGMNGEDRPMTLISVSRDVTAQREAEQERRETEEKLALGMEVAELALAQVDYTTGLNHLSAGAARLFGLGDAAMALPRAKVHATFHPGDREELERRIAQCLDPAGCGRFAMDHRVVWPGGEVRWLSVRKQVLFTGESTARRPARAVLVALDVTTAKTVTEAMRDSDERMRLATEATGVGIWEWNILTDTIRWDAQVFRLYGIAATPDGIVRYSDWSGAVLPEDLPESERILQETVRRGAQSRREFRILRRDDGELRHIEAVETVRTNADGIVEWVVGTNLDITARKESENRLRQAAADLSEAGRRKDEFLATLAHKLRNPLAPIRMGLQLMKRAGNQATTVEQTHDMMERQLTQLVRLVDDLMDVSRVSRGHIELRKERVPLAAVVKDAVETSDPNMKQMGHQLTVTLPQQPILVDVDRLRMGQVLSNLLNNAAKYSDCGGHVHLNVEPQENDILIRVKDSGIGIAAEDLPRIFEMFTQIDRSVGRSHGGLGIGLSLVKRLVEMHGGSVETKSEGPGKGSEFIVRLPVAAAGVPSQHSSDEEAQASVSPCRVLIVDDNRDAADSLATLLKMSGHDTRTAYDGQQAVDLAGVFQPDALLLDIGLPKLNGYEVCRNIRQQRWGKNIVLIAVTGWGQNGDRQRSKDAGFDHHMVKPVDPKEVIKILASVCEVG